MRLMTLIPAFLGLVLMCSCEHRNYDPKKHNNIEGTLLDFHKIGLSEDTRMLELALDPTIHTLSRTDRELIARFVSEYRKSGHGAFVMSPPRGGSNPQLANEAVRIAREIAWDGGINYEDIVGQPYIAPPHTHAPLIMAFRTYKIVPPACESLSTINLADISSNNSARNFGCSVRHNQAMMISDPADILGDRPLDKRPIEARMRDYEAYAGG